jgi:hypothetical protein
MTIFPKFKKYKWLFVTVTTIHRTLSAFIFKNIKIHQCNLQDMFVTEVNTIFKGVEERGVNNTSNYNDNPLEHFDHFKNNN